MSTQEAKDILARSKGFQNWNEMYDWIAREGQFPAVVAQLIESATEAAMHIFYRERSYE